MDDDKAPLISTNEAAGRIGVAAGTLISWRSLGKGPKYLKVGRICYYRVEDLRTWLESRLVDPEARKAS